MKTCTYCGRENPDDAPFCSGCGQTDFSTAESPEQLRTSDTRKTHPNLSLRIAISLIVGIAVMTLSLRVAYKNALKAPAARWQQSMTRRTLKDLRDVLAEEKAIGHMPKSLDEMRTLTNEVIIRLAELEYKDGWGRRYQFSSDGTNCVLSSYGRDGKPGGEGLDYDLTTENWSSEAGEPTFSQFLSEKPTEGMVHGCLAGGGLALVLTLLLVKVPRLSKAGLILLGVKLVATAIGALIIAVFISSLHIPSGH